MVTCTLDPRKLPRLCVGERWKRFHAKTWGRGGGGHTEFSRERRQVFPMQSGCSGGVGQCLRSARLLGASGIFSFLEMEFIRSWAIPLYVLHSVSGQPVAYLELFKPRKRRPRRKNWQTWSKGCCSLFPCSVISINFYKNFLWLTWQTSCSVFMLKLLISKVCTGLEGVWATYSMYS